MSDYQPGIVLFDVSTGTAAVTAFVVNKAMPKTLRLQKLECKLSISKSDKRCNRIVERFRSDDEWHVFAHRAMSPFVSGKGEHVFKLANIEGDDGLPRLGKSKTSRPLSRANHLCDCFRIFRCYDRCMVMEASSGEYFDFKSDEEPGNLLQEIVGGLVIR